MKNIFFSLILILSVWLIVPVAHTCTTFSFGHGNMHVVGKNYDWMVEDCMLMINKRGVSKTAAYSKNDNAYLAEWTSKYGSVTFNQYGRELPSGGMNEKGLVVEVMILVETRYPKPDSRPIISSLQWIQYQLDNFSSVQEVIASDSDLRINPGAGKGVHFLCTDREGNCASIEFLNGKLVCHTNENMPFKVLTNSTYEASYDLFKTHEKMGEKFPMPIGNASGPRFVRAASMSMKYGPQASKSMTDHAFDILMNVAQGRYTKWSIVYDLNKYRIYFKTFSNPEKRYIDIQSFDFSCATPVQVLEMNQALNGDMINHFQNYTHQTNRNLIMKTFRDTPMLKDVAQDALETLALYPEDTLCEK